MAGIGPHRLGSPAKMHCTSPAKKTGKKKGAPGMDNYYNNTRQLNDNLKAAKKAYQENRNPETKAALTEAKEMKRGGSFFATSGDIGRKRKLGEDYPG